MEVVLMPRRPTKIERDIPLWLILDIVKRGINTHGEDLEWIIVRTTESYFYNIRIRTRPVKRELSGRWKGCRIREPSGCTGKDVNPDQGNGREPE
ncbi:MAG: hypothetical protein ABSE07_03455 [Methanoregula sp.]|jgi:hypothetical protein